MKSLLGMWIAQIRWAKRYYKNGLLSYFLHKFGIIKSPTLSLIVVYTFKEDIFFWRKLRKG
ncbi:hypothetical protein FO497_30890 [Bacillus cereus ATCC 10876]|nr:hypothetical protein DJ50_885 [Bacillus cereus ATCC 10876]MBG9863596.1 hypothetical protein [Bacillus cereus]KFL78158.1 hypothetical protein DJ50_3950 [Bacillus cereus ATCC 10876]MBG9865977.1 hypothetical protein [Bacillus cereus]MBG9865996.1 hypothetical protein [Bacillus cereus]